MRASPLVLVVMLAPALLLVGALYLYPIAFNAYASFTDLDLLSLSRGGRWIGLDNYREMLGGAGFWRVLFNTAIWLTLVGVGTRLVLGLALALALNADVIRRLGLRTVARLLLIVPWATPPIVAVVAWRFILDPRHGPVNEVLTRLGLVDEPIAFLATQGWAWVALLVMITWNTLPLVTLSLLAGLQSIPADLVEAARIDGASTTATMRYVVIPLLLPVLRVMAIMSTFWTFNNFVYVWLATGAGPGLYTNVFATEVYIRGFVEGRLGLSAAIGMTMAAIMLAFGALAIRAAQRRSIEGAA